METVLKWHLVSEFHITLTSCPWLQEEEPQTSDIVFLTCMSDMVHTVLRGQYTLPNQSTAVGQTLSFTQQI